MEKTNRLPQRQTDNIINFIVNRIEGENRGISIKPKQRSITFEELYMQAQATHKKFEEVIQDIVNKTHGHIAFSSIKNKDVAAKKCILEYNQRSEKILDFSRSSIGYENMDDLYNSLKFVDKKYKIVYLKDRFNRPGPNGTRDILINVEMSNGYICEIQMNHIAIFQEKINGHLRKIYEEIRKLKQKKLQGAHLTFKEIVKLKELDEESIKIYNSIWEGAKQN